MFILPSCIVKKGIQSCDLYYVSCLTFFCFSLLVKLLIISLSKYYQRSGCVFRILGHTEKMWAWIHMNMSSIISSILLNLTHLTKSTPQLNSVFLVYYLQKNFFIASCYSIIYKYTELQQNKINVVAVWSNVHEDLFPPISCLHLLPPRAME